MRMAQIMWACVLGPAMALPAAAAGGRIAFQGHVVVPADCHVNVQARRGAPAATTACPARAPDVAGRPDETPLASATVRPLPGLPAGRPAYVVDLTYQ